ncbi:MAG: class I SAM-dependent methyltransferase [Gomphosphaeria aponina SAG 52.96 = DSM 107014]|uniref:Class I SAM-dependent methyltransferase n=1 Tax=Gomphosphaeria aponina SAG 52.96 = DSM 107014 TaxID=1521640 RepID=A0A941GWD4_9CHRO|nr:class I SAM-dependent methyltransferase [Gomphosphaeria aponina SAG 52.96 = DSM 107014]
MSLENKREIFPGEVFADTADFDVSIRQLLPRYDEMLATIVACVSPNAKNILELGCGTGELTLKLFKHCEQAKITAVDYSPRMLDFACSKIELAGADNSWQGIQMDFGQWANDEAIEDIGSNFDACVSSLAIHHLTNEMKLKLFARIGKSLKPGGVFWNGDPILPPFPQLAAVYQQVREAWAISVGTDLTKVRSKIGVSTPVGYSSHDQLATIEEHLAMLKEAGFSSVEVVWKYYGLAVFGGMVD